MFDKEMSWNINYLLKPFIHEVRHIGVDRILYAEYEIKNVPFTHDPYAALAKALLAYEAASRRTPQENVYVQCLCKKYGQLLYLELPRFAKILVEYGVLPQPHSPFAWLLRPDLAGIDINEEGDLLPCFQPKSYGH
jgi:hypothetical protein